MMTHFELCLEFIKSYEKLYGDRSKLILQLRVYFYIAVFSALFYAFFSYASVFCLIVCGISSSLFFNTYKMKVACMNSTLLNSLNFVFEYQDIQELNPVELKGLRLRTSILTPKPITMREILFGAG